MDEKKKFLGTGWKFPVEVDRISGRVIESSHEDKIKESIIIILQTQRGERIMNPEFGCNLKNYAFSEMNYTVMSEIESDVRRALVMWEPRIIDVDVRCEIAEDKEGVLYIHVGYVVRSTNNPYNLVYPFYIKESV